MCKTNSMSSPPIPNGMVSTMVGLAYAIRYFSCCSAYDIVSMYQLSQIEVMKSVWFVVDTINQLEEFETEYPSDHTTQQAIARRFESVSSVSSLNCAGCIDGLLIWFINHLKNKQKRLELGGNFLFERKNKFGLNFQAVADCWGRML